MGLRETKAARTRQQIVDVALGLFLDRGFDQVTMEEIAEGAEIGTSTLYRYFPSKDLLILDPLLSFTELGDRLRERPRDEPLEVALGAAIRGSLVDFTRAPVTAEVRRIVDTTPSPRAKLWDIMATSRVDLESAVADRMGAPIDDVGVALTSRMMMVVFEMVAEAWWAGDHTRPIDEAVDETLGRIQSADIVLPGAYAVTPLRAAAS
ncbi:TetR/AcrR family transcriptional regulator [Amnibacterium flavum]|nr:TetR family transcriptional regulator [Amnibacterium flavum]